MTLYTFCDGETTPATPQAMAEKRRQLQQQLDGYQSLWTDMDDDAYMARGNGFCDTKYSEDFLTGQITTIEQKLTECEKFLSLHPATKT